MANEDEFDADLSRGFDESEDLAAGQPVHSFDTGIAKRGGEDFSARRHVQNYNPRVFPFADLDLARRLERAEGTANARCVEARGRVSPEVGAAWIAVAGAMAMFDGPASAITQTFGLGLFDAVTAADLERIETFFGERGAPTHHEVSPVARPETFALLAERGYEPFEYTSVMYRPVRRTPDASTEAATYGESGVSRTSASLTTRTVSQAEADIWARTAAEGWSETTGASDLMVNIGRVFAVTAGTHLYLAELEGKPIAAATMHLHDGVALMAGASTIPSARGRGAQLALLERRLQDAFANGCDIAMMGALPGSISQRNAERHGFRIAYTRIKWRRR